MGIAIYKSVEQIYEEIDTHLLSKKELEIQQIITEYIKQINQKRNEFNNYINTLSDEEKHKCYNDLNIDFKHLYKIIHTDMKNKINEIYENVWKESNEYYKQHYLL